MACVTVSVAYPGAGYVANPANTLISIMAM